jgi:signal-transduction protein with cAMP-binding, CBS, and nucleotidyltransferase domain
MQVLLTLHAELFDKLPIFRDQPAHFLQCLLPELKLEYYAASEYVIWEGDASTEMYFITQGLLEVRQTIDEPEPELPKSTLSILVPNT